MATKEQEKAAAANQQVVVVDSAAHAAQKIAAEIEEKRAAGTWHNETQLRAIEEERAMLVERSSIARAAQTATDPDAEIPIDPANTVGLKAGAMPGADEEEHTTSRRRKKAEE
jgi:hypothetical protein